jgi:hypothetical protein
MTKILNARLHFHRSRRSMDLVTKSGSTRNLESHPFSAPAVERHTLDGAYASIPIKHLMKKERDGEAPAVAEAKKSIVKKRKVDDSTTFVSKAPKGAKSEKVKGDSPVKNAAGKATGKEPKKNDGKGKPNNDGNVFERTEAPFPPNGNHQEEETTSPSTTSVKPPSGPVPSANITFAPFNSLAPTPAPQVTFTPFDTLAPTRAPQAQKITFAPVPPPANNNMSVSAPAASPETPASVPIGPVSLPVQGPSSERKVQVPSYYIAFSASMADREPTDDEYALIAQLTTTYFEQIFAAQYKVDPILFERVDTILVEDQYLAISTTPDLPYNIYMTFNTSVVFAPSSSASATSLPSGPELLDIMDGAIGASYIVNYVWQATETPFISTNDVSLNSVPLVKPMDVANSQVEAAKANLNSLDHLAGRFVLPGGSRISSNEFRPENDPSIR